MNGTQRIGRNTEEHPVHQRRAQKAARVPEGIELGGTENAEPWTSSGNLWSPGVCCISLETRWTISAPTSPPLGDTKTCGTASPSIPDGRTSVTEVSHDSHGRLGSCGQLQTAADGHRGSQSVLRHISDGDSEKQPLARRRFTQKTRTRSQPFHHVNAYSSACSHIQPSLQPQTLIDTRQVPTLSTLSPTMDHPPWSLVSHCLGWQTAPSSVSHHSTVPPAPSFHHPTSPVIPPSHQLGPAPRPGLRVR